MRAEDLRLNNWVEIKDQEVKTYAQIEGVGNLQQVAGQLWSIEELEPIPLTEEWHNKFGVELDGFKSFRYKIHKGVNQLITVVFSGDYVYLRQGIGSDINDDMVCIWNKDLTKRGMYVHEWQNLYHTLRGQELTITKQ